MADNPSNRFNRRTFIHLFSALCTASGPVLAGFSTGIEPKKEPRLWDPLLQNEYQIIKNSKMAGSILQYSKKRYSCAESLLLASLEYLGKPGEWVSLAGGFGGGLGQRDLCGLLTAGIMAIGVAGSINCKDRSCFTKYVREQRKQYWKWWQARSPIHCREMRIQYDRPGYYRMIQRVAVEVERLISLEKI
jgi:hypothetical protein